MVNGYPDIMSTSLSQHFRRKMAEKVSVKQIRSEIAEVYGMGFAAGLKPRQVFAVYNNMKKRGKFEEEPVDEYYQMNLFDWLKMLEERKGEHIGTFI